MCLRASTCAPNEALSPRRPNNDHTLRQCGVRQLDSGLNHTSRHNRERFATQVTLVCRFVYCCCRIFRFRQQTDRQGTLQQPEAQRSQRVASLNTLGSSGGVDDSRAEPAVTGRSVANSSDDLGSTQLMEGHRFSTQLVEGNGGPRLGMPYADTDISVSGDANRAHIPMAEDLEFDWEKYINFEGNGDAC